MSHTLDARNLSCPLPILRTRKALNGLARGETLEVIATDPGAVKDMNAFCQQTGHALLGTRRQDDHYTFLIRKA